MKRWVLCILLLVFLSGCGENPLADSSEVQTQVCFTVTFRCQGQPDSVRQISAGTTVQPPSFQIPGYRVGIWYAPDGEPADFSSEITGDITFSARIYPKLVPHRPYLFADETGYCHPEAPLTGKALTDALLALTEDPALISLSLPEDEAITPSRLQEILSLFFPEEEVTEVLSSLSATPIPRQTFAACMNRLLDQHTDTRVVLSQPVVPCRDLPLEDAEMLLALLPHGPGGFSGSPISQALWDGLWEPGFYLINGWLYGTDETGRVLRDQTYGCLYFDSQGRYTSGDPELDDILYAFYQEVLEDTPNATREDLLYTAFLYCRDQFTYLRDEYMDPGTHGWENSCAKKILTRKRGNCYGFAAAFCTLARALGYQATAYSGNVGLRVLPHGWVVIDTPEGPFLCDPEMGQLGQQGRRDNWGEDMFWIAQEDWGPWKYVFTQDDLNKLEESLWS